MTEVLFRNRRILIVEGKSGDAKLLRSVLINIGVVSVTIAGHTERALDLLRSTEFQAVFCDGALAPLDAVGFAIALRRSDAVRNPRIPVFMVSDRVYRSQVEAGRDSGINDFIVRPLSTETIRRKLLAVLSSPKTFIRNDAFCGPDRRRKRDRRVVKPVNTGISYDRRKPRPTRRSTDKKVKPQS